MSVCVEQTFTQYLLCVRSCVSRRGHRWAGRGPPHPQMAVAPSSLPLPSPRLLPGALVHTAGCRVRIPAEVLILNSIVLPHKELSRSFTNQIIL